ncbi:YlbD family protein [Peribacillus simplex]|uniref:YlbD family protein n=1 Tax=Peribacillus simplex TaxID=1478 RepID=UPI0025A1B7A4|nr:YlbD family protein [Peribacillus simplex]MDM5295577.1 YlbD family protein [Peribacillus simplex]
MAKRKRPSVDRFREFVKEHPFLVNEVRNKQATWQELFEEWYLLGEDHPRWQADVSVDKSKVNSEAPSPPVEKGDQSTELIGSLMSAVKNMDMGQIQQYITNANQAIGAIQGVLSAFQGNKSEDTSPPKKEKEQRANPFLFTKD